MVKEKFDKKDYINDKEKEITVYSLPKNTKRYIKPFFKLINGRMKLSHFLESDDNINWTKYKKSV